ncbi:MAG: PEP-utilizing enzyme [Georgenia sp.]
MRELEVAHHRPVFVPPRRRPHEHVTTVTAHWRSTLARHAQFVSLGVPGCCSRPEPADLHLHPATCHRTPISCGTQVKGAATAKRDHRVTGEIAILLQRMVPAEYAGVAFTADPLTGERDVVRIGATVGLGDALVGGEDVGTDVTVRRASTGDVVEGDAAEIGTDLLIEVAQLARRVESLRGEPQNVEWAFAAGVVHLLQARPITVLPQQPELPDGKGWAKDVTHYPEPVTPFGFSAEQGTASAVAEVFGDLGMMVMGLEARLVGGEVYARPVPAFGRAGDSSPPPALVLGVLSRVLPPLRALNRRARAALDADLYGGWIETYEQSERSTYPARTAELRAVDMVAMSDHDLADHADGLIEHATAGQRIHFRLGLAGFHALHGLHHIVGDALGWDDAAIATMLVGHSPATRASEAALAVLRSGVRASEPARTSLAEHAHQPVAALFAVDPSLANELKQWIDEHGWGCVNYDAGTPVLAEHPRIVTQLLLGDPEPPDHAAADRAADTARAELPADLRDSFDEALHHARRVYSLREDNIALVTDPAFGLLRRWLLETSRRLTERRLLRRAQDAAYLTLDEHVTALRGMPSGAALVETVKQRRGEEAYVRAQPGSMRLGRASPPPDISRMPAPLVAINTPILWAMGHEFPESSDPAGEDGSELVGVAAAPGVAEGTVRIVSSHADLSSLDHGEVLVCRVTTPAWAPLFPVAAAIVADGGGVLSHAAIAAREHGLPAVLGTGTATTTLHTGDRVRVDGTRGRVTVL